MPSWREPPPESLSCYIGLWGRLLVYLYEYGYYPIITWIWINPMHDSKLEPNYMKMDLFNGFYLVIMYFIINYMSFNLLYRFYSVIMDFITHAL